jgi:hypothetical protein
VTLRRGWRRLRSVYSWQPIGGLAILLLLGGLVLDTLWGDYALVAQRYERVEADLAMARMRAEHLPGMEARARQVNAEYGGVQGRLIVAQGDSAASEKFGQQLRGWYEARGVTQVSVRGVQRREADGLVYYRADVDAAMRIEQLVELLQGKSYAPVALKLVEASVNANDDNAPTGLRTAMTWEGLLVPAAPEEAKSAKTADSAKKGARPAGRGANENPPAIKTIEEKRK